MTTPAAPEPTPQTPANAPQGDGKAPWEKSGEPFDAARAWQHIQNLQAERDAEKAKRAEFESKFSEAEKSKLSDLERAQAEAAEAKAEAQRYQSEVLRLQILREKGVPDSLADFVNGTDKDSLKKSADKVLAAFQATNGGNPLQRTPLPASTGLNDSEPPVETDPAKLAATMPRLF